MRRFSEWMRLAVASCAAVPAGGGTMVGPGLMGAMNAAGESAAYSRGGMTIARWPSNSPPRVVGMDAALALRMRWRLLMVSKVGSPTIGGMSWSGKLYRILSTEVKEVMV